MLNGGGGVAARRKQEGSRCVDVDDDDGDWVILSDVSTGLERGNDVEETGGRDVMKEVEGRERSSGHGGSCIEAAVVVVAVAVVAVVCLRRGYNIIGRSGQFLAGAGWLAGGIWDCWDCYVALSPLLLARWVTLP
jgi:hypothetical protein